MPHGGAVPARSHPIANPHATPYAFPAGKHPELAEYLNEKTEYDPASGCLLWVGPFNKEGSGRVSKPIATKFGSWQAAHLAWRAGHGRKLEKGTNLYRRCGNPRCVNPHHLKEADSNDTWRDPDLGPPKRQGSVGALKLGKRILWAQEVYQIQTYPLPRDPSLGLPWMFKGQIDRWFTDEPRWVDLNPSQLRKLEIIRAVRRCPIRATLTVLPCGFRRYDLPAGITEIAFTEPPPLTYEEAFGLVDADEDPETAPAADWALAA
ncbi:hypothetical protein [Erythrobacter sp.]|uniref:hypothetical protein n=1 Tax=Erythrobacter sp. TaxID=1042 RepID=UPI00311D46AF